MCTLSLLNYFDEYLPDFIAAVSLLIHSPTEMETLTSDSDDAVSDASPSPPAATTHPFPQDMTSSLSPGRPGDNEESTLPNNRPGDAPDSSPVDTLITAESHLAIPSTLAATTTSIPL
jgi:hypothetical protein